MTFISIEEQQNNIRKELAFALKKDPIQPKDFLKAAKINLDHATYLINHMGYNLDYKAFDSKTNEALLEAIRAGNYAGIGPSSKFANNHIIGYYCALLNRAFKKEEMKPTENIYNVDAKTMSFLLDDMMKQNKLNLEIIKIAQKVIGKDKVNEIIAEEIFKTLKPENAYILNKIDMSPEQKDKLYPKLIKKYKLLNKDIPNEYKRNSHVLLALLEKGENINNIRGSFQDDFSEVSDEYLNKLGLAIKARPSNLPNFATMSAYEQKSVNPYMLLAIHKYFPNVLGEKNMQNIIYNQVASYYSRELSLNDFKTIFNSFNITDPNFKLACLKTKEKNKELSDDDKIRAIREFDLPLMKFGLNFISHNIDKLTELNIINVNDKILIDTYNSNYSKENEAKLLSMLEVQYNSIDEYIDQNMFAPASKIGLFDLCALTLYTKKMLHQKGLNHINVVYDDDIKTGGRYEESKHRLIITSKALSIGASFGQYINTIHHEINHVQQFKDIKEMNLEEEDVLEFSVDKFLMNTLSNYYLTNYNSISFEFDADHKAFIDIGVKMQNVQKYDRCSYQTLADAYKVQGEYTKTNMRVVKNGDDPIDMFEILDMVMESLRQMGPKYKEYISEIKKDTPILAYLYDLKTGKRRTNSELMLLSMNSTDPKEKDIYNYLAGKMLEQTLQSKIFNTKNDYKKYSDHYKSRISEWDKQGVNALESEQDLLTGVLNWKK